MIAPPREIGGRPGVCDVWDGGVHLAAHAFENRAERGLHVPHLIQLVVAPRPVEAKDGDSPAIFHVGIDLAEGLLVRDHLAAPDRLTVVPYSSRIACFIARP